MRQQDGGHGPGEEGAPGHPQVVSWHQITNYSSWSFQVPARGAAEKWQKVMQTQSGCSATNSVLSSVFQSFHTSSLSPHMMPFSNVKTLVAEEAFLP